MFGLIVLLVDIVYSQSIVSFKTTIIDSPVDQVIWCGGSVVVTIDDDTVFQDDKENDLHKKVVFVLSNKGILYRSMDYGFKWENVSDSFQYKFNVSEDVNQLFNWKIYYQFHFKDVIQSPADSHIMYLIGQGGKSFRTNDCGRTYSSFNHNKKMFGYRLNKMDKDQIIAFQEKICNKTIDKLCRDQYKRDMFVTLDGGTSWKQILSYVRDANWDKMIHYELIPDNRIIATHLDKNGDQIVSMSDSFYENHKILDREAFGFYQSTLYLFILVRPDQFSNGYDLKITSSYQPQEITLPVDDQNKHTFTVLDTSDSQIFLSVSHSEDLPKLTNVYMSRYDGRNEYVLSLLGNVRSIDTGNCDFEHVKGLEGAYIANIFDYVEVDKIRSRRKKVTNEKEMKMKGGALERLDAYKKSVISFDKGSNWHSIKAPKLSYNNEAINCGGECSLHLKGRTESLSNPIYTSDKAAGIILATGNTGLYLTQKDEEINTYLSRDGGHTWFEILSGSHIYEIGDHGGVITLAQDDKETNKVFYSWDEGLTFDDLIFSTDFNISVDNIVTEPSNMEQKFILYGRQQSAKLGLKGDDSFFSKYDTLRGVLVSMDFTSLHQRVCTGQWDPTMPESDYEFWYPQTYDGDKCLFGKKIKILRRKRNAKCFNAEDVERQQLVENCPCTQADWECDYGYYRKIDGGECIPQTSGFNKPKSYSQVPVNCKGTYTASQGYRKIAGDVCEGGVYLGPIEMPCPETEKQKEVKEEIPKMNFKEPEISYIPSEKSFIQKYSDALLIIGTLVLLIIFRKQVFGIINIIFSATKANDQLKQKKSYYPPTEEEIQEKQKSKGKGKAMAKYSSLISKEEDDEESGL